MGIFILKRKNYNTPYTNKGDEVGSDLGKTTGGVVGGAGGAILGAVGAGVAGAAIGADKGMKAVTEARENLADVRKKAKETNRALNHARSAGSDTVKDLVKESEAAAKNLKNTTKLANSNKAVQGLKKAGKWGALAAGGGALAGALIGKSQGSDVGSSAGRAVGSTVGATVDTANNAVNKTTGMINIGGGNRNYSATLDDLSRLI